VPGRWLTRSDLPPIIPNSNFGCKETRDGRIGRGNRSATNHHKAEWAIRSSGGHPPGNQDAGGFGAWGTAYLAEIGYGGDDRGVQALPMWAIQRDALLRQHTSHNIVRRHGDGRYRTRGKRVGDFPRRHAHRRAQRPHEVHELRLLWHASCGAARPREGDPRERSTFARHRDGRALSLWRADLQHRTGRTRHRARPAPTDRRYHRNHGRRSDSRPALGNWQHHHRTGRRSTVRAAQPRDPVQLRTIED